MSHARARCQFSSERWESPGRTVRFAGRSNDDGPFQVATALDHIPRLMHELKSNGHASGVLPPGQHDHSTTNQKERAQRKSKPPAKAHQGNGTVSKAAAGSPTRYDSPCYARGAAPLSPPPRALELVKEEVHRALQAFSTRPLKGQTHPPPPRALLKPYDVTRDGRITYPEFRAGLRGLGIGLTAGEAEALARDVDSGDTGLVDREQFEAAATEGWGREAAVVEESSSGAEHRNGGNETAVYDRGDAPLGGTPPRGRKSGPCQGGQQLVEPRHADDFYIRAGECRGDGQHGRFRAVTDSGGKVWKTINRGGGSQYACGDESSKARIVYGRGDGMEVNPHAGAQVQELPPPPPTAAQKVPGVSSNSHATATRKSRNSAVSFEQWHRRMTSGGGRDDGGGHAAKVKVPAHSSIDGCGKPNGRARASRERADSLNTLRSLLRGESPEGEPTVDGTVNGNRCQWFASRDGGNRNGMHRQQHKRSSRQEEGGHDVGRCEVTSDGERRVSDKGDSLGAGRYASATVLNVAGDASASAAASAQQLEREQRHAGRAESILTLRSKGDLVGLRRAISKADPSASGVISQREMERVILRRFGAGFSDDESKGLAARYCKEVNGRAMVDYERLCDSLEAKEAGLCGAATMRWEQPSTKMREKHTCSSTIPSRLMPAAAGARRSSRRMGCTGTVHEGDVEGSFFDARPEESQLARRARAKTLALLDQHGTRSADQVFGLLDPARTQSLTAEQFREGLRILSGSEPLSDIEYKALFRDVGGKHGRIKHNELMDTLRNAEGVENRERTQRKIAHQAKLPASGRGSAVHWRHSDILDWYPPGEDRHASSRTPGGKQHKETRRRALVFEKIRERVRRVQDDRDSAGPVLDMFHRRGGGGGGGEGGGRSGPSPTPRSGDGKFNPPPLSPSALRAGLRSLGVPLGDDDFDAVLASTDPDRHGEVSYPKFCEVLRLRRLRGNDNTRPDTAVSGLERPSSAPPLSSQAIGQGLSVSGKIIPKRERSWGRGSARCRAMELAPAGDRDLLDGGVFHRNPATDGCSNPNFTTTMVRAWNDGGGRGRGRTDGHGSGRRQLPAPAPALTAACTVVQPVSRGQTLIGDNRFHSWNETGAGAERRFRQDLGAKARRHRSHSLSCHGGERVACEGWDNMGTPSPRNAADGIGSSRHAATTAVISGGSGSSSISRRGRGLAPRDSDLGFGSARMRSASRLDDRCSVTSAGGRRRRRRRHDKTNESTGLTRRRSMSLGVDDRYGAWARSSVGDLLRHDTWLGARCHTAAEGTADRGRVGFAETAQGIRCGGDHHFTGHESSRYHGEGGKRRVAPYATDADMFEVQQQRLRTGSGHGGERGSGEVSAYRGSRNEQRQTMSVVTDRRVASVGGAERRGENTHGLIRGRGRVGEGGARREGGGSHGEGRGRTANATNSGDTALRRAGGLRGELSAFSGEFHDGGGQFSPTRRWDNASLPTGHDRARGHAVSTHSRGNSRPPKK